MKKRLFSRIIGMVGFLFISMIALTGSAFAADTFKISGSAHVQDLGWVTPQADGNPNHILLGTTGQSKRMEAYTLDTSTPGVTLQYQAHVQDIGWMNPVTNGQVSGTEGQAKRVEGFRVSLTGQNAKDYTVYYRTHVQNYGWLDWAKDGQSAGTTGHSYRCEALEIIVLPKEASAPGRTTTPCIEAVSPGEAAHLLRVNAFRAAHGKAYVTSDPNLHAVASLRVQELPTRFSHYRPNGSWYDTAVKSVFPNYRLNAGGVKEIIVFGAPNMSDPNKSFDVMTVYPHFSQMMLDDGMRYLSWEGHVSGTMGYAIEMWSGLDRIDFAD